MALMNRATRSLSQRKRRRASSSMSTNTRTCMSRARTGCKCVHGMHTCHARRQTPTTLHTHADHVRLAGAAARVGTLALPGRLCPTRVVHRYVKTQCGQICLTLEQSPFRAGAGSLIVLAILTAYSAFIFARLYAAVPGSGKRITCEPCAAVLISLMPFYPRSPVWRHWVQGGWPIWS